MVDAYLVFRLLEEVCNDGVADRVVNEIVHFELILTFVSLSNIF